MANLFIPSKLRVGFVTRQGTFTGKLAYVIYYDEKGKIRKEVSWDGWRDKKIPALELDNKPRNNYVFNKGIRRYSDWGSGRSVIRVYDPRDFEFEITVDNLIGILMHSDVSKRDIVEECVFAWAGKELVLLPVTSEEYQASLTYTAKQSESVSTKELVKGYTYGLKKQDSKLVYLGFYRVFEVNRWYFDTKPVQKDRGKKHVFYNREAEDFVTPSSSALAGVILAEEAEDYAALVVQFQKTLLYTQITGFEVVPGLIPASSEDDEKVFYKKIGNGTYRTVSFNCWSQRDTDWTNIHFGTTTYTNVNGVIHIINKNDPHDHFGYWPRRDEVPKGKYTELTDLLIAAGVDLKKITVKAFKAAALAAGYGKAFYILEDNSKLAYKN